MTLNIGIKRPAPCGGHSELLESIIHAPPIKRSCPTKIIDPSDDAYWSPKQLAALKTMMKGENILLTGPAGTGKTALINEAVSRLQAKHGEEKVFVTAMTGMAALHLNGTTLHYFAGVQLGNGTVDEIHEKILKVRSRCARWYQVKVLVIDEISMLTKELWDKIEAIARLMKQSSEPFGGIQIILSGDFYQLPPFDGGDQRKDLANDDNDVPPAVKPNRFVFVAESWKSVIKCIVNLDIVYRQQNDMEFTEMLSMIRIGQPTDEHIRKLESRVIGNDNFVDQSKVTSLYSKRVNVERQNDTHLRRIVGEEFSFVSEDNCKGSKEGNDALLRLQKDCTATATVKLKVGAFVVLLRNMDQAIGLVNGSRGNVVTIHDKLELRKLKEKKNRKVDEEEITDENNPPTESAKTDSVNYEDDEDDLYEPSIPTFTDVHGMILARQGEKAVTVLFENGLLATIGYQKWTVDKNVGKGIHIELASRSQIPFSLAWALTIHKSQGMTLLSVVVSLNGIFAEGQGYVALSRVTSLSGLYIEGRFDRREIAANPYVAEFYASLAG